MVFYAFVSPDSASSIRAALAIVFRLTRVAQHPGGEERSHRSVGMVGLEQSATILYALDLLASIVTPGLFLEIICLQITFSTQRWT